MYANYRMEQMLEAATGQLGRRDLIGYAAARNVRLLDGELTEYMERRDALLAEHGEEDGEGGFFLTAGSPGFPAFAEALGPFASVEHEFEPFRIPYAEAIGQLTGEELLELDWMFEDGEEVM